MERTKALAASTAATLALGSGIVAAASITGASFLGFGVVKHNARSTAAATPDGSKPGVVVRTRNVYDRYVVETANGTPPVGGGSGTTTGSPGGAGTPGSTPPTGTSPEREPRAPTPTPTTSPPRTGKTPSNTPTTRPEEPTTPPAVTPTTPAPSPTTIPATWPIGVPKDWPPDKPIPPMPPNCGQPQLEDNGVWNCDH